MEVYKGIEIIISPEEKESCYVVYPSPDKHCELFYNVEEAAQYAARLLYERSQSQGHTPNDSDLENLLTLGHINYDGKRLTFYQEDVTSRISQLRMLQLQPLGIRERQRFDLIIFKYVSRELQKPRLRLVMGE